MVHERAGLRLQTPASADGADVEEPSRVRSSAELQSTVDALRVKAAWRQWLASMASDAEAALAAAIAYRDLDATGRERWLEALKKDAEEVDVPSIALYAPLLAVERDAERRARLLGALALCGGGGEARSLPNAYSGQGGRGARVYVLVVPLYLDFVQVLACEVRQGIFEWVRHDPIVRAADAPSSREPLGGARLERVPMKCVLDELASAVLSHRRSGRPQPEALEVLADLLDPLRP